VSERAPISDDELEQWANMGDPITTPRDDIAGLSERLRISLAGVAREESGGDNLAILLASYFEPSIEDEELDDSGTWKQGALDACDKVLDAIHAHYATQLAAQAKELAALRERLESYASLAMKEGGMRTVWQARALRAEQERDEACERLTNIDRIVHIPTSGRETAVHHFQRDFDAIRAMTSPYRLASDPEKEEKP
jgi:hypothetical protein